MKQAKITGILFLVVGLLMAVFFTVRYCISLAEAQSRIYTTARIVRIEERKTGDPENPIEHRAFVDLEVDGEMVTAQLNTYHSGFTIGQQLDVYYFENELQMVYEKGSEHYLLLAAFCCLLFALIGAIVTFRKPAS